MIPGSQASLFAWRGRLFAATAFVATFAFTGLGTAAERMPQPTAAVTGPLIRAAAEVLAVDPASRTLTLRREDGNTLTLIADRRIRNFAQVRIGDIVIAQYGHARAHTLRKARQEEIDAALAAEGNGSAPQRVGGPGKRLIVADIIAIDDRTRQATVKGLGGEVVDVVVPNRKMLGSVRIGDRIRLEYTRAVAISIKPAGAAVQPRKSPGR